MSAPPPARSNLGSPRAAALIVGISLLMLAGPGYGQSTFDTQSLIRETQKISRKRVDGGFQDMTLVWWVPVQFWERSLQENPATTKQTLDKFRSTLEPYTMLIVMSGKIGPFGGMTFTSEDAVRASVTLRDAQNVSYSPLPDAAISADAKNLLSMMKPLVVNMLGPMGQNLNWLVFKSKTNDGRPLADPMTEGSLVVVVAGDEFRYRLPLGSLLPAKYDPATHDEFPGNYVYSPFTGSKLVTDPRGDPQRVPPEASLSAQPP